MMTTRLIDFLFENDWTAMYAVLVWIGAVLAVVWSILMRDNPANKGIPPWDLRLRRAGIIIMVVGFLLSVLFGGDRRWAPWPTQLVIAFGFDFYLGAAIMTSVHRAKSFARRDDYMIHT